MLDAANSILNATIGINDDLPWDRRFYGGNAIICNAHAGQSASSLSINVADTLLLSTVGRLIAGLLTIADVETDSPMHLCKRYNSSKLLCLF
jgi:hypothetical protein